MNNVSVDGLPCKTIYNTCKYPITNAGYMHFIYRATALDVEPVYTFRAHQGPVLCLAMSATGEECFSGGVDSTIRCWNLPSSNIDPYDSYGEF